MCFDQRSSPWFYFPDKSNHLKNRMRTTPLDITVDRTLWQTIDVIISWYEDNTCDFVSRYKHRRVNSVLVSWPRGQRVAYLPALSRIEWSACQGYGWWGVPQWRHKNGNTPIWMHGLSVYVHSCVKNAPVIHTTRPANKSRNETQQRHCGCG